MSEVTAEGLAAGLGIEQPVSDDSGQAATEPESTTASDLDWGRRVNVDGLGEVALSELRDGYLRQSDYTRKTQELARQREEIPNLEIASQFLSAYEVDPVSTVRSLAEQHGLSLAEARAVVQEAAAQEQAQESSFQLPPEIQQKLAIVDQIQAKLQQQELQAQIEHEISTLKDKYKEDFDEAEVVQYALLKQTPDLELAFLALQSQKQFEKGLAQGRKEADKRERASVESGTSVKPSTGPVDSFEDAYSQARRQHVGS